MIDAAPPPPVTAQAGSFPAAWSPSAALPLSAAEEARLRRQISCLRRLEAQDRTLALGEWDKGSYLRRVRDEGLWRRSAEHPAPSFLEFVKQVSNLNSRGAVERRLLLVERYSREEFQEYVAAKTEATALCAIARAEEELRPHLLQLARRGLTAEEVGFVRGVGQRLLRRPAQEGTRSLGPELARHLHEERERREEKRRLRRGRGAAERGAEAPEVRAGIEELGAERHALEAGWTEVAAARRALREREEALEAERRALRAQAVPPGPAQPGEREAALAARAAQPGEREAAAARFAEREMRLGEREAALSAREAGLGEREAALSAREAGLGERQAEMQREAEEAAAARFAERETRIDEGEAALAAREAQLGEREAQLGEREAQLGEAETGLHKITEEQAAERADLDFHRDKVAKEAEALAALRAQLGRERVQLLDWAVSNQRVHWPAPPRGMDEALLWLRDRLLEAQAIGELGRHLLDKKRELPQYGTVARVFETKDLVQSVCGQLAALLKDVATDVRRARPSEVDAYLRQRLAAERDGVPLRPETAPRPAAPRPPQDFARPTSAILGTAQPRAEQHGVLGVDTKGELVTLDYGGVQTVGLFGQQGAGESHSILALAEGALPTVPGVSRTPEPLCVIHCHYHGDADSYAPPYGAYFQPNGDAAALAVLRGELQARPQGLQARRRLVFVPPMDEAELARRRAQLPGAEVQELRLSARELGLDGMKLLMGAGRTGTSGGTPLYMMKIGNALAQLRDPSPAEFRAALAGVKLPAQTWDVVEERLRLIDRLLGDEPLGSRIGPGDFVGLDMRAPWMDESMAMAMFTVSMNAFAQAQAQGEGGQARPFRKMMIFDEAHKYMGKGQVSAEMLKMVREMRHRGMWIVYASQDPESVHPSLIKLSSLIVAHQLKAKSSLKVLRECAAVFGDVEPQELAGLARGEALVLAGECAEPLYRLRPQKLRIRPTCARTSL